MSSDNKEQPNTNKFDLFLVLAIVFATVGGSLIWKNSANAFFLAFGIGSGLISLLSVFGAWHYRAGIVAQWRDSGSHIEESPETENPCYYCATIDSKERSARGVPDGYCGICSICGKPGHIQHFPGPIPYTGIWCDHCVKILYFKRKVKAVLTYGIIGAVLGYILLVIFS